MEDKPISKKDILKELDEIQSKDHKYSDGRILGSMCTDCLLYTSDAADEL